MAALIEQCHVAPHPDSAAELTLPLTYFDYFWLAFHRMRRILFYKHPISKIDFVQTIIPSLKNSLSFSLKHYLPLAGNIVCPLSSNNYPELCYVTGDSISLTFSETDMDFNFLTSNRSRNAKDFYPFVPQLADPKDAHAGVQSAPVLAIQVTLFPNHGISIGFTNHHVVGDGASISRFISAWALLNKFGGDEQFLTDEFIPFYDKSIIKDPYGQARSTWHLIKTEHKIEMCDIVTPPQDKVRGTFIIQRDDIEKLKNLTLSKQPSLTHVTSFIVTCAYVWTCLIKSEVAIGEDIDENETEVFGCAADCRARLHPPLPPNYFGNCIVAYITSTRHADLAGDEGFTTAVRLIREAIQKRMNDQEYMLSGEWFKECCTSFGDRTVSVAGSPKFDLYAADFGWGRPEKVEFVSIDSGDGISMSLGKSRNSEGDLEVGLSLPKSRMNAFAAIFTHGLSML